MKFSGFGALYTYWYLGSKTSCLQYNTFPILEDNPVVVGQKTTDDGQCNTFPIVDNDPGCEQEDSSKTSFLSGTQGPVPPKNNCKT